MVLVNSGGMRRRYRLHAGGELLFCVPSLAVKLMVYASTLLSGRWCQSGLVHVAGALILFLSLPVPISTAMASDGTGADACPLSVTSPCLSLPFVYPNC